MAFIRREMNGDLISRGDDFVARGVHSNFPTLWGMNVEIGLATEAFHRVYLAAYC